MKKFKETDIKYLAGLLDADGSMVWQLTPYKDTFNVSLKITLQQSESIDRGGEYIKWLASICGNHQHIKLNNEKWSDANRWTLQGASEIEMFLNRILKHMVIKAKHWNAMHEMWKALPNKSVSKQEAEGLRQFAKVSRKAVGPLKPKKHPTWPWVAGYLDGDGCYHIRKRKKNWGVFTELLVKVVAHDDDIVGLELLNKAFKGNLKNNSYENTHHWTRNLGNADRSFAIYFLRKVHRHSRLKKWKIEQLLHHHLQRLSESNSTE